MAILLVKLFNDDDVIADVEDSGENLVLKNPIRVVITQQGVGMMPMNPFSSDKDFTVNKKYVVYTATAEDELKNAYNSKYGNGIMVATAPSGLILG